MTEFNTAGEAWKYAVGMIEAKGSKVITEDGKQTKEIQNMLLTVKDPSKGWPIPGTGWNVGLETYAKQLLDPSDFGFDYSYGNRLRSYFCGLDQINEAIKQLKKDKRTRRAVMITWDPTLDLDNPSMHHPCMIMLNPLIRDQKLNLTAVFRSHDMKQAYPQNLYGLYGLQEYMRQDIGAYLGTITTLSVSAHVYLE